MQSPRCFLLVMVVCIGGRLPGWIGSTGSPFFDPVWFTEATWVAGVIRQALPRLCMVNMVLPSWAEFGEWTFSNPCTAHWCSLADWGQLGGSLPDPARCTNTPWFNKANFKYHLSIYFLLPRSAEGTSIRPSYCFADPVHSPRHIHNLSNF